MNGMGTRRGLDFESDMPAPLQGVKPSSRAMADGYRQEIMSGFEPEPPRYNPMNPERPQSSPLVDLQDPIQVHLLTETALSDSREWEILSQEEVDGLKKQCQSLGQRIEQTRANLAIQTKYRDAAISMTKLYSPTQATGGKRRSLLGHRRHSGGSDASREADAEREACERRCEELAEELFMLEKRIMDPQRRLLQHTAGILQLTHRGSKQKKTAAAAAARQVNGIPGSPESLYTSNNRESLDGGGGDLLDERSLYLPIGEPFDPVLRKSTSIAIPQKSPQRKETMELREESSQLRAQLGALEREHDEQQQAVAEAERQAAGLSSRLHDMLVQLNAGGAEAEAAPPAAGDALESHLRYMDDSLAVMREEQTQLLAQSEAAAGGGAELEAAMAQLEGRLGGVNGQLQRAFAVNNVGLPPLPMVTGDGTEAGVDQQLRWLQGTLPVFAAEVERAAQAASASAADREATQQNDTVLVGLWEVMQKGFAELQSREGGDEQAADEVAGLNTSEAYSLTAFATRVQWLYGQTTKLREQKAVLQRQIKQQRELNNKSDAEKDAELEGKTAEVQRAHAAAESAQDQLARALADLSDAQQTLMQREVAASAAEERAGKAEEKAGKTQGQIAALEARGSELQGSLAQAEAQVASLGGKLQEAETALKAAEARAEAAAKEAQSKDAELEQLNGLVVELKTEATIAKAELDGAYGSRAQRAADVAALAKSSENSQLQSQTDQLRTELAATLAELEGLTKDTLAAEREKLDLEAQLDDALAAKTALENEARSLQTKLEAEVASLREALDAERLKVAPAAGSGGTSRAGASMLSEQFRATMKEERKKFQEELRTEQMQRRKLEEELRQLKRAAGPGKSPLSPGLR